MTDFAKIYGSSLYSVASDDNIIDKILKDLELTEQVLLENPDYIKLLDSPVISKAERIELINQAFAGLNEYVLNFIKMLCEKSSVHQFVNCKKQYEKLYNKFNNIEVVTVVTAYGISDDKKMRLKLKLEKDMGKKVVMNFKIDKTILGGMVIRTENSQTDASLKSRLNSLKKELSSAIK